MKKKLNIGSITNELEGASVFFQRSVSPPSPPNSEKADIALPNSPTFDKPSIGKTRPNKVRKPKKHPPVVEKQTKQSPARKEQSAGDLPNESKNDNLISNDSNHVSMQASMLAPIQDDIVETIRKTVKQVGKDTLFVRLTPDEKHQVTSVVYALNEMYRGDGRKTSENEIGRIGVNFLLEDYKANGNQSILVKVLAALNA